MTMHPAQASPHPLKETSGGSAWEAQRSFDELGRALRDVTFCVVDLETTGGSAAGGSKITEVGAVKIRGGEVLGEFQTLVNPREDIPAFISMLTGITNPMVAEAPDIFDVLPRFLDFAAGSVLVAHNAPFDVGFLKHNADVVGVPWPSFEVLDTAVLARRILARGETANCKLGTLAQHFGATTTPNHRALADARATVDVLHGLIARLGSLGVHTLEELSTYSSKVTAAQRKKRHLAEHLTHAPGVYFFIGPREEVLYVGTSRDLRSRVRRYFTASETRSRMGEMVALTTEVRAIECSTALEAAVRELRLIARHKPRYNRRSRFPERQLWIKVTTEPWPRLSIVRSATDVSATYLGPFSSKAVAESSLAALHETYPVRQCSGRLPRRPARTPCVLAEMGRCLSPCDGSITETDYAHVIAAVRRGILRDPAAVWDTLVRRMDRLSVAERFEEAQTVRDRLAAFLHGSARIQRLTALTGCAEIVAAAPDPAGWIVHVIRWGRLAGAGVVPAGADPGEWVARLRESSETVVPAPGPLPASSAEEAELLRKWLEGEGVRLIHLEGTWSCPIGGAARLESRLDTSVASAEILVPFDEASRTVRGRPLAGAGSPVG